MPANGRITVARLGRPRGNRGELFAEAPGWSPAELSALQHLSANPPGRPVAIESAWTHQDRLIVKLRGVDSIADAEALRGADLTIAPEELPPPGPGEYYFRDLIGCRVLDERTGELIGEVTGCVQTSGAGILLEVSSQPDLEPFLVPLVPAICGHVDVAAKQIRAVLPDGLIETQRG